MKLILLVSLMTVHLTTTDEEIEMKSVITKLTDIFKEPVTSSAVN